MRLFLYTIIINLIFGIYYEIGDTSSISMCQFSNADSNFDNTINIQDIINTINIIIDGRNISNIVNFWL